LSEFFENKDVTKYHVVVKRRTAKKIMLAKKKTRLEMLIATA